VDSYTYASVSLHGTVQPRRATKTSTLAAKKVEVGVTHKGLGFGDSVLQLVANFVYPCRKATMTHTDHQRQETCL
jgi:hypothetical protein